MFYKFSQNNTGGSFTINSDVTATVIIEAASAREANSKAEDIGIYFDGVRINYDCECCGDRWYEADESDAEKSLTDFQTEYMFNFAKTCIVYFQDGTKVELSSDEFKSYSVKRALGKI